MGLSPEAFNNLTPAEFIYAWAGWSKREQDRIRHSWELTRWQTWVLTSIQLDKKDRKALDEMFPLPWDRKAQRSPEGKEPTLTIEERLKRVNEILKCTKL